MPRKSKAKPVTEDKPLPKITRPAGVPASEDNSPAPAFDPPEGEAANPTTGGKSDPSKSATAPEPPGPRPGQPDLGAPPAQPTDATPFRRGGL